jgi:type IV pilus assembly protein PilA
MKSNKCQACGFVGWSDSGNCKSCGASLGANPGALSQEGPQKGLAIFALVLGILSFLTFGLLGVGAITGIIVAVVAMNKVNREPWKYGGKTLAIVALVLNITSLGTVVPVGIIAAIAIPNLIAARKAANEASAIATLRTISMAESTYQSIFQKFGTLEELEAEGLIDPALASGTKNGYRFTLEVTKNEERLEGFEVVAVPMTYQSSGRRSFFVDESMVIRAGDNNGGPSTVSDRPLESDYDSPRRTAYSDD